MLVKGTIHEYCFYVLLERLSHGEFFTKLHLSLLIQGLMVVLLRSGTMLPLTSGGTCSLINHDRHVGSVGGRGLCSGEEDIAAKPLWKMPNFAVVGSQ